MRKFLRHAKRGFGKVWVLEDDEAAETNSAAIKTLTKQLIAELRRVDHQKDLTRQDFARHEREILKHNSELVAKIDKKYLISLVEELQKYTLVKYRNINEKEIIKFYTSILDLFEKPLFVKALEKQMESKRHLHGLEKGILKHLWSVSLLSHLKSKGAERALLARAAMLHDIALLHNNYVADLQHQKTAADLARKLGEPEEVVKAVEDHLFFDMIRLHRLPRTRVARKLLWYDSVISVKDRIVSVVLKVKNLFGKR
jgi:putative nucleotidyltransferase with HDIG domain